ncbi:MAG: hypothetical protein QME85_05040 [Candidatus Saccharicenans sp.]|nr:hypothetical protein [Candidatus Saccharicenans sp.]
MKALIGLREVLKKIANDVEVLPAVGGAIEDLERPDFEEFEDRAFNAEERIFDAIFEREQSGKKVELYRSVTPEARKRQELFRYFLDGSFRSYFLGTIIEHERESPVIFAQIGACVLERKNDGSVSKRALDVGNVLMASRQRLSDSVWNRLEGLAEKAGVKFLDLTEKDIITDKLAGFDLRIKAGGKIRFAMRKLEIEFIKKVIPDLSSDEWLIADGSLLFNPLLEDLLKYEEIKPVIGVSKNFRKDPQFVIGRGPKAERLSIYQLLANLRNEHRTAAFSAREGKAVFWYVRIREQKHMDYPLMGVIKVELVNPSREPLDSRLLDKVSAALIGERHVTPHGQDRRWHVHLYPIFLAERMVKESFMSREAVQQYLKWR